MKFRKIRDYAGTTYIISMKDIRYIKEYEGLVYGVYSVIELRGRTIHMTETIDELWDWLYPAGIDPGIL